jgi:peptidylprolyl isomerase
MPQVKEGDKISVHYTGKLEDGTVFESSGDGDPLKFTAGGGDVIGGFDQGVVGMAVGDKREIKITPDDGYGHRQDGLVVKMSKAEMTDGLDLKKGQLLRVNPSGTGEMVVEVVDVDDASVTLDGNHPLAGKELLFDVEVIAIDGDE